MASKYAVLAPMRVLLHGKQPKLSSEVKWFSDGLLRAFFCVLM